VTQPVRLQLSRVKGFNLQALSRATNGLDAVVVSRPSRWGNPHRVAPAFVSRGVSFPAVSQRGAVHLFAEDWRRLLELRPEQARADLDELRGKNLACWCKPGEPCHADVLLELANGGEG
jgi:hypothetical protein